MQAAGAGELMPVEPVELVELVAVELALHLPQAQASMELQIQAAGVVELQAPFQMAAKAAMPVVAL